MSCSEYEMKFNITPMQAKQFRKSGLLPPKMKKKEKIKQLEARVRELEEQNCNYDRNAGSYHLQSDKPIQELISKIHDKRERWIIENRHIQPSKLFLNVNTAECLTRHFMASGINEARDIQINDDVQTRFYGLLVHEVINVPADFVELA